MRGNNGQIRGRQHPAFEREAAGAPTGRTTWARHAAAIGGLIGTVAALVAIVGGLVPLVQSYQPSAPVLAPMATVMLTSTAPSRAATEACPTATAQIPPIRSDSPIYVGTGLIQEHDIGLDTEHHSTDWLTDTHGTLVLHYPPIPDDHWGVMNICPRRHPSLEFTSYAFLGAEMRSQEGGARIRLGIKDVTQNPTGTEATTLECLTPNWQTIALPLNAFAAVDLKRLFVLVVTTQREFDTVGELETETYWEEPKESDRHGGMTNELTARWLAPRAS
jgi:hypothetical protein